MSNKPQHKILCPTCDAITIVSALPSEVCSFDCKGCDAGLHCDQCGQRGIKQFDEEFNLCGRTVVVYNKLNRNVVIDGQAQVIHDQADLKRKLKKMGQQQSERYKCDMRYGTDWDS